MRNVFKLFSYDIKHLFGNVITVVIVLGLVFLPSIFTWYNVIACWNVFDNTGNLKVAVANSDGGYQSDLLPTKINVGDSVESALRANDQLDWVFTDEEDAIDGARSGKYYAAVVIPQSFSSDMMSFYSEDAEHAELIYYENEKKNAVAPRVTDQASSKVAAQVNTTFAETISDVALGLIDSLGAVADDADAAGQVAKLSGTISSSADQMRTAADVLESYANLAGTAQALVGSSTQLLGNAQSAVKDAQQQASGAKSGAEAIGDALKLNPIKVRKLLITAGVYESEVAEKVQDTFEEYRETQNYKEAILSTANTLQLSKASVTSYLPYKKGVYYPGTEKEKISVGAERQRRYRAMKRWRTDLTEENFWGVVVAYAGVKFKTYSGLPFTYEIKKGRNGEYTKELWIDRREKSKSLAWSSVPLALQNIKKVGEVVDRPKALGDIRGVTYIYGMFYRFGLIDVPDEVKEKMGHPKTRKK